MPANVHPPRQHAGVAALVGGEERVLAPWSLMVCVCAGGGGGQRESGKERERNTRKFTTTDKAYTRKKTETNTEF